MFLFGYVWFWPTYLVVQFDLFVIGQVVSFAVVIRAVTQYSSPTNGYSLELCIPFLNKSLVLSNELITVELPP